MLSPTISLQTSTLGLVALLLFGPMAHAGTNAVAQGRFVYLDYCASCHGIDGAGNGPWRRHYQRRQRTCVCFRSATEIRCPRIRSPALSTAARTSRRMARGICRCGANKSGDILRIRETKTQLKVNSPNLSRICSQFKESTKRLIEVSAWKECLRHHRQGDDQRISARSNCGAGSAGCGKMEFPQPARLAAGLVLMDNSCYLSDKEGERGKFSARDASLLKMGFSTKAGQTNG